ncbi:MAG TPA: hypothetical protein VMT03_25255 [Polyangia bacterium]|nr:hypothetical protein [Polyangia bacterium]
MAGLSKLVVAVALAVASLPLTDEAVRTEVDRLVAAVATTRHLTYHGTLPVRVVDRAEAAREAAHLDDLAAAEPAAQTDAEILRRLGLVATPRADADAEWDDDEASPRFDAVTGRLWVPGFVSLDAQRVALTHEVAHAVADQRFSLRRLMDISPEGRSRLTGDARRARQALVEGDAMLTGLEVLDPRETFLGVRELAALAARLRASAAPETNPGWGATLAGFTHVDGLLFVARTRQHRPWSAVDALWTDPPGSTEQILHPEKYESCEAPVTVDASSLPALPGLGHAAASDTVGELAIRAWLSGAWNAEVAARAAAGWGGDRAGLYTRPPAETDAGAPTESKALAWLTVWDDPAEADDFARAARPVLERQAEKKAAEAPTEQALPDGAIFSSSNGLFGVARKGDAVALLVAAPEGSEPALAAMLGTRRPEPSRRGGSRPRPSAPPGCQRRGRAGGSE